MSRERELLKVAIDFINPGHWDNNDDAFTAENIKSAIEAELAKPGPDPVGYLCPDDPEQETAFHWKSGKCCVKSCGKTLIPLYTSQPTRQAPVRLSDEDCDCVCHAQGRYPSYNFIRAVEQLVLKVNGLIK